MRRLKFSLVDVHSQGHHRAANVEVVGEHEDGGDGDLYMYFIYNAMAAFVCNKKSTLPYGCQF